jgi:endonuclease-3
VIFWRLDYERDEEEAEQVISKGAQSLCSRETDGDRHDGREAGEGCKSGADGGTRNGPEARGGDSGELIHENPFQLLISTILSAQCTDVRVNQVTQTLYKKYPNAEAFAHANPSELQQEIRPTGFFRNKTKSIMGASKGIIENFGGQVPRTMEEILTLPGVARKTANVVLGTAYGIASGVVVDTHVIRLSRRLDLTKHDDPKKIEEDLIRVIPKEKWITFSHQLILHGRRVCVARKPRCIDCNLESLCYSKDKTV